MINVQFAIDHMYIRFKTDKALIQSIQKRALVLVIIVGVGKMYLSEENRLIQKKGGYYQEKSHRTLHFTHYLGFPKNALVSGCICFPVHQ